jgi:hypothetical protein
LIAALSMRRFYASYDAATPLMLYAATATPMPIRAACRRHDAPLISLIRHSQDDVAPDIAQGTAAVDDMIASRCRDYAELYADADTPRPAALQLRPSAAPFTFITAAEPRRMTPPPRRYEMPPH